MARLFDVEDHENKIKEYQAPLTKLEKVIDWQLFKETLEKELYSILVLDARCNVVSDRWHDPFKDQYFTDPSDLDIDHYVPLANAHASGAWGWNRDKKRTFANDLPENYYLIAFSKSANCFKGSGPPYKRPPPNKNYHYEHVKTWKKITQYYNLHIDDRATDVSNRLCEVQ